ncbi:MAG: hypothetical protein KZQ95_12245 [Candidatus Thiodiazotropha sp. (ex Epidulcina cf. delphinae)]|nr:hypothetical protein [Candidatus Thiodiazotropha sp. (ex Epidulcina cf. delphinae)]
MLSENEIDRRLSTSELFSLVCQTGTYPSCTVLKTQGSIRELEIMAAGLRQIGDAKAAESIDMKIMSLLEKKICKKIIDRSRREQLLVREERIQPNLP